MPPESKSRLHKFQPGHTWSEVAKETYKEGAGGGEGGQWCGIDRNTIIGGRGESAKFSLRYFEIAPGGNSSLEKHNHEHVVIGVRGKGRAVVEDCVHDMEPLDVLYIAPGTPHQLVNPHSEPFGFFCIVDAERDRPRPLEKADIERLESSEAKGKYIGYVEGD